MIFAEVDKDGRLIDVTGAWAIALAALRGKRVILQAPTVWRANRSDRQNRYYFGVVVKILGDELGYTKDEMNAALCVEHLSTLDEKTGLMRIRSTKDLNTAEFEDFTRRVREWASALPARIFIPLPNEPLT